jgi:dienelactone hydrolase
MAAAKEEEGGVEAVVTWGAVTGRGYVREIKAFNGARASSADPRSAAARAAGQGEEAAGFLLTPQTMSDLAALEAVPEGRPLAARVLVLDRTDLAGDQKLYDRLAASAKVLERRAAPGYLQMMAYPHLSVVPDEAWAAVEEFLGRAHPRERSQPHEAAATPFRVEGPAREEAVRFDGDRLFGIVCEPPAGAPAPSEKSAVLLLTMACHHRIGPNRLHTRFARELAAKGYGSLRFDVSGTGDSAPTRDGRENTASRLDQADDVVRAMDLLQARGYRRFCAVGVCSGAFFGFHAALADPRLVAMVAVNPQKLEPNEDGEVPEESPTGTAEFKGTASYKRALFAPQTWLRLLRGEINVRRIAAELARRGVKRLTSSSQASYLLTRLKRLTARGFRYLMIFGADDVNKDYVERCLGPDASRLGEPDRVRVVTVAGAEHTFGQMWAQDELSGLLSSTVSSWLP